MPLDVPRPKVPDKVTLRPANGAEPQPDERAFVGRKLDSSANLPRDQDVQPVSVAGPKNIRRFTVNTCGQRTCRSRVVVETTTPLTAIDPGSR